jgi:DNA helicase-2/ATP-dependent DNA helicase PcrA
MSAAIESAAPVTWLDSLNEPQRRAATFGVKNASVFSSGPLLIIAGAGTGKTNTLAHRVAHLLLSGVHPDRVLLLTFTRRAAQEMIRRAERIVALAKRDRALAGNPLADARLRLSWSGTFHSIANRLLRKYAASAGLDPAFTIADRGDAADMLDALRQELGLTSKDKRFPRKDACLSIYSHRVNSGCPLADTLADHFPWCSEWEEELTQLFRKYVDTKLAQQTLDYDDLLLYWRILMQDPALAAEVGALFDHVLVDEYQDTNTLQADILLAMKPAGAGLCVVGDDAQAIFSFRAATVEHILEFPTHFTPAAEVVALEQNYRSTQPVLDASNALLANSERQYRKQLWSQRSSGQKPFYVNVEDDAEQAVYVATRVLEARERGVLLKRQAVLMRSSHHSDVLEIELMRRNIPFVKYGGLKFLEAAHVKDLLAILRWAENPRHRLAGFRVLQFLPGMGPAHADRCLKVFEAAGFEWGTLAQYQSPASTRQDWPAFTGLMAQLASTLTWADQVRAIRQWFEPLLERMYDAPEVRKADLAQLERLSSQYGTREEFLSELTLEPPQASSDYSGPPLIDEDYLILSTIHSAKGQEWDSVYVLNVSDGNFPSEFATGKPALIEEERRLLYVAMTRAKQDLHLVAPLKYHITQQTRFGGKHLYGTTSRFLTPAVMTHFDAGSWSSRAGAVREVATGDRRVDVAAKLRQFWS